MHFLEIFISPYVDVEPEPLSLVDHLHILGYAGKIRSFLPFDYEIIPGKAVLDLNDTQTDTKEHVSYAARGFRPLKVAKLGKNDFILKNYPWLGKLIEAKCSKKDMNKLLNQYSSKVAQSYEIELEENIFLLISIESAQLDTTNARKNSRDSAEGEQTYRLNQKMKNSAINLTLMPRNIFLNFSGVDILLKDLEKEYIESPMRKESTYLAHSSSKKKNINLLWNSPDSVSEFNLGSTSLSGLNTSRSVRNADTMTAEEFIKSRKTSEAGVNVSEFSAINPIEDLENLKTKDGFG